MVCAHYPIAVIDAFKESIKKIFIHKIFCQGSLPRNAAAHITEGNN